MKRMFVYFHSYSFTCVHIHSYSSMYIHVMHIHLSPGVSIICHMYSVLGLGSFAFPYHVLCIMIQEFKFKIYFLYLHLHETLVNIIETFMQVVFFSTIIQLQISVHGTKYVTNAAKQHIPEDSHLFSFLYVHFTMCETTRGHHGEIRRG